MFVGRTQAHIIPDAPFKVSLYDYLGALTQGVTAIRVSQGRYSNKYVSLTPCDTRPMAAPWSPHHHDGHEPSSCEHKINHLSFVMNSAKAISLFIFFKWNRDKIKVRKYIRRNYLSWLDVILSCLFNWAQMFVCRKNLAFSNEELKGWLIQLLGLYQKLTTDREIQNWNCPADTEYLQFLQREKYVSQSWHECDLIWICDVNQMWWWWGRRSWLTTTIHYSVAIILTRVHLSNHFIIPPLQLFCSPDSLSIICLRSKSDAMGSDLRSISN